MTSQLWKLKATKAVQLLKQREIKPSELVIAAIERIEEVDDKTNALPIRCFERALKQAKSIENANIKQNNQFLCGLPIAVKDYNDVGGVLTTFGSPIFTKNLPEKSDETIARLESHGAIPIAKSNVPEWAGGNTFNSVHGITRNPWNLNLSAGGSSGGSAAALASGQVWLATGNDLGGSLRTPAGFNGVVGLRPSPGIIPRGSRLQAFDSLWVEGPMGRSVDDVALMLDAGRGQSISDPISFNGAIDSYLNEITNAELPKRVAFSSDLNIVPVAQEIRDITTNSMNKLVAVGIDVSTEIPDFTGSLGAFHTLRSILLGTMMESILTNHRTLISEDIIKNIEHGFKVTPQQIMNAERIRWKLSKNVTKFFDNHDFLVCPSASIEPFPVEQRYVKHIDGELCETYIDWFAITFALTLTACPVISIPCGFTQKGLPVGIQILGPPRGEKKLLQVAHLLERLFSISSTLPINPREEE